MQHPAVHLHHLQDHSHPSRAPFITAKQTWQTKAILSELCRQLWVGAKGKNCQTLVAEGGRTRVGWWYRSKPLLIKESKWTNGKNCNPSLHPIIFCSRGFPGAFWSGTTSDCILERGTIYYPKSCSISQCTMGIAVTGRREILFVPT